MTDTPEQNAEPFKLPLRLAHINREIIDADGKGLVTYHREAWAQQIIDAVNDPRLNHPSQANAKPGEMAEREAIRLLRGRGFTITKTIDVTMAVVPSQANASLESVEGEREAFEAWFVTEYAAYLARDDEEGYKSHTPAVAWRAWQAALSRPAAGGEAARISALETALTKHAVKVCHRLNGEFSSLWCQVCNAESETMTLTHKPGCVLSTSPAPAPAVLTGAERRQVEEIRAHDDVIKRAADLSLAQLERRNLLAIIDRLTGAKP